MLDRVYNILVSVLGDSKQGGYSVGNDQYQFNSPWGMEDNGGIPDGKYNLEVNLGLGKFHEWVKDKGGSLSYLIKRYGNRELLNEYFSVLKDLKETQYYSLGITKDTMKDDEGDEEAVRLPETFTKIDLTKCNRRKLIEYLNKRKITQGIIDFYNIGYTTWDESEWGMRNRVIIPSYDANGVLNYWVGRDFDNREGSRKTKYKNPKVEKTRIVCHEDKIQWDADIVLVEGAIDCLYYPNAIPLLGKKLSREDELFRRLYEKSNGRIIICLDSDTEIRETKVLYNLLNTGRMRNRIWYIRLGTDDIPYKDFGEVYEAEGKKGIIKILKSAKQFNEIDLLI